MKNPHIPELLLNLTQNESRLFRVLYILNEYAKFSSENLFEIKIITYEIKDIAKLSGLSKLQVVDTLNKLMIRNIVGKIVYDGIVSPKVIKNFDEAFLNTLYNKTYIVYDKKAAGKLYRERPDIKAKQKKYMTDRYERLSKDPQYIISERLRGRDYYQRKGKFRPPHSKEMINKINLKYYKKKFKLFGDLFDLSSTGYSHALGHWSKSVKYRDNLTCQVCESIHETKNLRSHHLLYKNDYPLISLNINNGITLCIPCHNDIHYPKGGDWS